MTRRSLAFLAATLAACTVPPPEPPPPRGGTARPQRARPATPPAATPAAATAAPTEGATPGTAAGRRYQVRSDGTVGCADPQAPRLLRQLKAGEGVSPRILAQAHRDGRCLTTFRTSRWTLERAEGEVVRLRLDGGGATALYFLPDEVAPADD